MVTFAKTTLPTGDNVNIRKIFLALAATMALAIQGAQAQHLLKTSYEANGLYGSGSYAPFWHIANRQGLGSTENASAYTRLGIEGTNIFNSSNITLQWGADAVVAYNLTSTLFLQQAYFDFKWRRVNISIGQKERWGGYPSHRISTGALVESGNARPIPQIRVELPEYWNIPGTKGWLAIRGHIAYGFFTDDNWQKEYFHKDATRTENVLYHSKSGFMRIGNKERFPLTAEIGLYMVTQFGGSYYNPSDNIGSYHHNPTRLKDFFYALIPMSGDASYDACDQTNVAGNMLGSWNGAITWSAKEWMLRAYYDHTFEDQSQMFWEYGLWTEQLAGLELELKNFKWISNVTFEYFNLKKQSGPIYNDTSALFPDQISCKDSNYNHGLYAGWFNYGQMIATPLCTAPIYNPDRKQICYNNRVEAFHFGIEGEPLKWLGYRALYTRSNNWGTYSHPFKEIKTNRSLLAELTFKPSFMKGWSIATSFALDNGKLYGNNYGGMITIKGYNIFNLKKEKK